MKRFIKNIFFAICIVVEELFPSKKGHVLMYHSFNLLEEFFNVSFEDFTRQIEFLEKRGYIFVSSEEFLERKEKGLSLKKYIVVTCDDGYIGFKKVAEYLNQKNIPITLFWPTRMEGDVLRLSSGVEHKIFSREEALQVCIEYKNVTVGSHGVTHRELSKISGEEALFELKESLSDIQDFSKKFHIVAYPRGKYNKKTIEIAKEVGYCAGYTTKEGGVDRNTPIFEIPRLAADSTVSLFAFRGKLTSLYSLYVTMKAQLMK